MCCFVAWKRVYPGYVPVLVCHNKQRSLKPFMPLDPVNTVSCCLYVTCNLGQSVLIGSEYRLHCRVSEEQTLSPPAPVYPLPFAFPYRLRWRQTSAVLKTAGWWVLLLFNRAVKRAKISCKESGSRLAQNRRCAKQTAALSSAPKQSSNIRWTTATGSQRLPEAPCHLHYEVSVKVLSAFS